MHLTTLYVIDEIKLLIFWNLILLMVNWCKEFSSYYQEWCAVLKHFGTCSWIRYEMGSWFHFYSNTFLFGLFMTPISGDTILFVFLIVLRACAIFWAFWFNSFDWNTVKSRQFIFHWKVKFFFYHSAVFWHKTSSCWNRDNSFCSTFL